MNPVVVPPSPPRSGRIQSTKVKVDPTRLLLLSALTKWQFILAIEQKYVNRALDACKQCKEEVDEIRETTEDKLANLQDAPSSKKDAVLTVHNQCVDEVRQNMENALKAIGDGRDETIQKIFAFYESIDDAIKMIYANSDSETTDDELVARRSDAASDTDNVDSTESPTGTKRTSCRSGALGLLVNHLNDLGSRLGVGRRSV